MLRHLEPGGSTRVVYFIPLPPGEWVIAVTRDLNDNDLVNHNLLGTPIRPSALLNNVHPHFKVSTFDDCKCTVRGYCHDGGNLPTTAIS